MGTPLKEDTFDPYYKWLGIPAEEQPPSFYRLLSLSQFETDEEVISAAADRQMAHLKTFQTGSYSAFSQQLLNEVSRARLCLLHPDRKQEYDAGLREKIRATTPPPPATPTGAPAPPVVRPTASQSKPDDVDFPLFEIPNLHRSSGVQGYLKSRRSKRHRSFSRAIGYLTVFLLSAGFVWGVSSLQPGAAQPKTAPSKNVARPAPQPGTPIVRPRSPELIVLPAAVPAESAVSRPALTQRIGTTLVEWIELPAMGTTAEQVTTLTRTLSVNNPRVTLRSPEATGSRNTLSLLRAGSPGTWSVASSSRPATPIAWLELGGEQSRFRWEAGANKQLAAALRGSYLVFSDASPRRILGFSPPKTMAPLAIDLASANNVTSMMTPVRFPPGSLQLRIEGATGLPALESLLVGKSLQPGDSVSLRFSDAPEVMLDCLFSVLGNQLEAVFTFRYDTPAGESGRLEWRQADSVTKAPAVRRRHNIAEQIHNQATVTCNFYLEVDGEWIPLSTTGETQ